MGSRIASQGTGGLGVVVALFLVGFVGGAAPAQPADDPPRLEPGSADAKPATAYAWNSAVKGLSYDDEGKVHPSDKTLRYTWVLPQGYETGGGKGYDLVVIFHGTGLDYRWGHWNFKPGSFRPHDVVVSVDGPTEAEKGTRLFLGMRPDTLAIRDFLLEAGRTFHAKRIYLYGHSQGSFFAAHFAGEFPAILDGIVAQSSGAWNWSRDKGGIRRVPMVFLHGTSDPVVPYDQSPAARNAYRDAGNPLVHLRRMPRYNHWPNAVRASECIDWCIGMRTEDAAEALAMAESILAPKPPDEYEYACPVDFGGARRILRRIEEAPKEGEEPADPSKPGPPPLKDVTDKLRAKANALAQRIEAEGQRHVDHLIATIKSRADLVISETTDPSSCGWIGHLASIREDFRTVDSVEAYAKQLELDAVLAEHATATGPLVEAWFDDSNGGTADPKAVFAVAVESLPRCFLYEGLPLPLAGKLAEWRGKSEALGIPAEVLAKAAVIDAWQAGWEDGFKQYALLWKAWR